MAQEDEQVDGTQSEEHVGEPIYPPPPGWGKDELSSALATFHQNAFHIFVEKPKVFQVMRYIHDVFAWLANEQGAEANWFAWSFVPRSFSASLAATRLAFGGQVHEAAMCIRGSIENALYAFHINRQDDPDEMAKTYLCRHDSGQTEKMHRKEFSPHPILKALEEEDAETGNVVRKLYNWTIDYGAHPNPTAHLLGLSLMKVDGREIVASHFTGGSPLIIGGYVKSVAEGSIGALKVFRVMLGDGEARQKLSYGIDGVVRELNAIDWKQEFPQE